MTYTLFYYCYEKYIDACRPTNADLLIRRLPEARVTATDVRAVDVDADAIRTHTVVLAFVHVCIVNSNQQRKRHNCSSLEKPDDIDKLIFDLLNSKRHSCLTKSGLLETLHS